MVLDLAQHVEEALLSFSVTPSPCFSCLVTPSLSFPSR